MNATNARALRSRILCIVLVIPFASSCEVAKQTRPPDPGIGAKNDRAVTQNQARLRMRSLVDPMCGQIEEAADAIMASTTDPKVRLAALNWKIEGVPASAPRSPPR